MPVIVRFLPRRIGPPTPAHALTEGAEAARETVRRLGWEKRLHARISSLVTKHGNPKRVPYDGVRVPAAARSLEKLASVAGYDVKVTTHAVGCVVEGLHAERRVGFRAYWERGTSKGATWHSGGRDHWKLIDISDRPIGVDKIAKTTKAKHRHDETDSTRLVLVESPRGVNINVTELRKRIKG